MADSSAVSYRTLLFGSRGMIGSAVARLFQGPRLVSYAHQELDITDFVALERSFIRAKPEIVFNAAAFTKVDECERLRETAFLANAEAPGHIADLCRKYDALLVHFSTDFVFDGKADQPYTEDMAPAPVNFYGFTKWEGEKRVQSSGCRYLLVRSSWIFGKSGDNFVKKLLKRALAGAALQAPIDQKGSPTYADDLASATFRLFSTGATGICHFRNSGECTRYEQATTILQLYGLNNRIEAAKNESLPSPAKRPAYSVLDINRYLQATGHIPRSWQQSTAEYISFLKENEYELKF